MFRQLREDIAIVKEKDPAARSSLEILLTYSGLKAVRSYRRAHWFYQHKWFTIARIISQRARHKTGIEIHPGAQIGKASEFYQEAHPIHSNVQHLFRDCHGLPVR